MLKIRILIRAIKTLSNWPVYLADYFGLVGATEIYYRLRSGIVFAVRAGTNDRVLFNQVWLKRTYMPRGFDIKDGDLIVDIGAHVGFFSIFAAKKANKGRVYSFEPAPENFEMLQRNIGTNGFANILPLNEAVAGRGGEREFILYPKSTGAHSFIYSATDQTNIIKVKTIGLDELVEKNDIKKIDFLKMDCEGAEYEILFNTPHRTLEIINKIAMEYHDMDEKRNVGALKKFLERNGFRVSIKARGDNMFYAVR